MSTIPQCAEWKESGIWGWGKPGSTLHVPSEGVRTLGDGTQCREPWTHGRSVVKGPQLLAHDGIHRTLGVWERRADAKGGRLKAFRHSKAGVLGDDLLLSYPHLRLLVGTFLLRMRAEQKGRWGFIPIFQS